MMFDPCVHQPGLHVFRVEKMKLVLVPKEQIGTFFSGDSYLLLNNVANGGSNLHFWIGKNTSVDEQGACAMFCTQLDTYLSGHPVQYREAQGNESEKFMSYFPKGTKYQDGGVASGLHKVHTDLSQVNKLYVVKGKKNIRATEVSLSWESFNKGDCFILDLGERLFVWSGSQSNILERNKAKDVANQIRDNERNAKAHVEIVQEGEEPEDMIKILGAKPALKEGNPEEDIQADEQNAHAAVLYKVSNASGKLDLTKVSDSSPFAKQLLDSNDCFILDNGKNGRIFIWKGKKANKEERQKSLDMANEFITQMKYSSTTQVQVVAEENESGLFKQFFKSWA